MRRAPLRPVLALALALVAGPATVAAQEPPARPAVELRWRAPAGCPTAAEVRAGIARALDASPFTPGSPPGLVLAGETRAAGDRWAISLSLSSRAGAPLGRRELVSDSGRCADALDSVALVAAMMIESPRPEARLRTPPPRAPFGGLVLAGRAGAAVDLVTGPTPAVGAHAELEVTPPGLWPLRLGVSYFPEVVAASGAVSAHLRFLAVALAVCPSLLSGRLGALAACAGLDVLLVDVYGTGLEAGRTYLDATPRPLAGIRGELVLAGPLRVGAGAEVAVPLARYHYDFKLDGVVVGLHELPVVTMTLGLWLALQLP